MQFKIWIDDANHFTIDCKLSNAAPDTAHYGPEVVGAIITDQTLPDVPADEAIDVLGQCIDLLTTVKQEAPTIKEDWREHFRKS